MKFRHVFLGLGSFLVLNVLLLSDPDSGLITNLPFGGGTMSLLIILASSVLYIGLLHLARKALLDYIDLGTFFKTAVRTPEGAGLAIVGVGLIMISVAIVILTATS